MQKQSINENGKTNLTDHEQERLDQLLTSARNFHYISFILAGLSLAMASIDNPKSIILPILGFELPALQASVAIYFISLIMALVTEMLFSMAFPWLQIDTRRPPFPWFALGQNKNYGRITAWIVLPAFLCSLFSSLYLKGDYVGMGLIYGSLAVVLLPRTNRNIQKLISNKSDHRGGHATFSIFLLYWYRLSRQTLITVALFLAVFTAIPSWRPSLIKILGLIFFILISAYLVRGIGGIPFVYQRIDKLGKKFGFPIESEHYK
jgi:hypothetical protein